MPIFGEYETVGEAIAVANESGHVATIWRARRSGATDLGGYVVKVFAPHRQTEQGSADDALDRDRGLDFLEGVKQVKKATSEGARCLAPVHAFGTSAEGAWYVTDYFQRGSLEAWISRRVNVDSAALRQIVTCLITGCLELKRSRGNSHGNLKTSNVFLAGQTRPLRKTPLVIADAHPAVSRKIARLGQEDRSTADNLLHEVMEAQDLRAIGEIILQLVEGRLVSSAYDYNYPVPRSAVWNLLGKDGERWLELCNQLLDPQLSLAEINLETLAKKFPAGGTGGKLVPIASVLVLLCLVSGGAYGFIKWNAQKKNAQFEADLRAAKDSFAQTNLVSAWARISDALKKRPEDGAAKALSAEIEKRNNQEFEQAVSAAREMFGQKRYPEALSHLDWATSNLRPSELLNSSARELRGRIETAKDFEAAMEAGEKQLTDRNFSGALAQAQLALAKNPNDSSAKTLKAKAQTGLNNQTVAERDRNFKAALAAGQSAYDRQDYAEAIKQADAALANKTGDVVATKLKSDAQTRQAELGQQAERDQKYQAAMDVGRTAYSRKDYTEAIKQADAALANKTGDAVATKLKTDAQARQGELATQAERDQKYKVAMDAGQSAYDRKDYVEAIKQADAALAIRSADAAASKLKTDTQARQGELAQQAERDRKYSDALAAGQAAYGQKDYAEAIKQADAALAIRSADAAASKLKTDAQARQGELAQQAERDRKYSDALAAGQAAYGRKDYAEAIKQADAALAIRSADAAASKLKTDTQARQGELAQQAERDRKYSDALAAGQTAYGRKDYAEAIKQADIALAIRSADAAASKLKTDTQARQAELAQQAERDRKYSDALAAGQAAYGQKDYAEAIKQADAALANRTGDATAVKLKTDAEKGLDDLAKERAAALAAAQKRSDLESAQSFMKDAKYDQAIGMCNKYPGDDDFKKLSQTISLKQSDFNNSMRDFEVMLVNFNILKPKEATYPEAKKAEMFGPIGLQLSAAYLATASKLHDKFKANGWLAGDREKNFQLLEKSISRWE